MSTLGYDRFLSELVAESDQFADTVVGAADATPVPTCPEWTVEQLAAHVGFVHRWAHAIVSRRAAAAVPEADVEEGEPPAEPGERDTWLRVGARRLARAVTDAGPHTPVWTWDPANRCTGYWARRMTHETMVHRADAAFAVGAPFTTAPDIAADAIGEWLELLTLRGVGGGGGQTLRLDAVDEGLGEDGHWLITRGPDGPVCTRPAAEQDGGAADAADAADVALRGKAVDLMLVVLRRAPRTDRDVELSGDVRVLDDWLEDSRV